MHVVARESHESHFVGQIHYGLNHGQWHPVGRLHPDTERHSGVFKKISDYTQKFTEKSHNNPPLAQGKRPCW